MPARQFRFTHNDVTYIGSRDDEAFVVGSITMGEKKWTLKGHPKINKPVAKWLKHGDEVQITIWNVKGTTYEKPRVRFNPDGTPKEHKWDTVEIFFTPEVWNDLMREYYKAIKD